MDFYCGFHRGEVSHKLSRRVPINGSDLDRMSRDHASPAKRSQGHARLRFAVSWGLTVRRSRARAYCPTFPTSGFNSCAASGRVVPQLCGTPRPDAVQEENPWIGIEQTRKEEIKFLRFFFPSGAAIFVIAFLMKQIIKDRVCYHYKYHYRYRYRCPCD